MSMVPYAVEHARCLPGNTCLVRKVLNAEKAKDMASLEEIQQVMKVSIADKGAKAYHSCIKSGCMKEVTGMHTCGFANCSCEIKQISNMTIHENRRHTGFRYHCETDGCQYLWVDNASYTRHKRRVHGLAPAKRDITKYTLKRPHAKLAVRRVAREDSVISEASSYHPSDGSTSSFSIPTFGQSSSPPESNVFQSNSWPPSSDFAYTSTGPSNLHLYAADTLSQPMSSLPWTSAAPHHNNTGASGSSRMSSAVDMSLGHRPSNDGVHGAYGPGSALPYGNEGSGLSRHPSSVGSSPFSGDPFLGSNEYSQTTSSTDFDWSTLDDLLAIPLSDVSFDPTLETAIQLGYLDPFPTTESSTSATYPSFVYPSSSTSA